jgi:hypothetical protein
MTIGGKTYKNFYAFGINNYGTITGFYYDSSGVGHAFKRYSNGTAIALNYPAAAETYAYASTTRVRLWAWYRSNCRRIAGSTDSFTTTINGRH